MFALPLLLNTEKNVRILIPQFSILTILGFSNISEKKKIKKLFEVSFTY